MNVSLMTIAWAVSDASACASIFTKMSHGVLTIGQGSPLAHPRRERLEPYD
jgi:hypothetical protein